MILTLPKVYLIQWKSFEKVLLSNTFFSFRFTIFCTFNKNKILTILDLSLTFARTSQLRVKWLIFKHRQLHLLYETVISHLREIRKLERTSTMWKVKDEKNHLNIVMKYVYESCRGKYLEIKKEQAPCRK